MRDITKTAVERQLKGMRLDRLELSITDGDRPNVRTMTPAEIIADLARLKRANKAGCNIYVRGPRDEDHDLILLDDIDRFTPDRMTKDGMKPAVVVETSPGNFQAWINLGEPVPADLRREAAKIIAQRYSGDPGAVDAHQSGRLAGFTNAKPEHRSGGLSPFVIMHSFAGKPARYAWKLINEAKIALDVRNANAAKDKLIPALTAETDLVNFWLKGHASIPDGKSLSEVDWYLTNLALGSGRTPEDIAAALVKMSDRKGKHAESYAIQTVTNAVSQRNTEDSPSI